MSVSRGLISGEAKVHLRTSGMYDSNDNVRIANITTNGLDGLGLMVTNLVPNVQTAPYDFAWSKDGYHLYVAQAGDYIVHYTVTIPFTNTGKTQVESFNILTYDSSNYAFEVSPDGKYFYGGGADRDGIFMFSTTVPYYMTDGTLTEATSRTTFAFGYNQFNMFLDNIYSLGSEDAAVQSMTFNGDGTKMYLIGTSDDYIQQFTLSTPYKIGDAHANSAYDGYYSLGGDGLSAPMAMRWNNNGTKFFVVDLNLDAVVEYSVSNAYDVTTGTITEGTNFSVSSYETAPTDVAFNADGTRMFVLGDAGNDINEWTLSTGFDLSSTVTYVTATSTGTSNPRSFDFSPDGTFMAVVDWYADTLRGYTLSTPFDASTISLTQSIDLTATENSTTAATAVRNLWLTPSGCRFNGDGTSITILDRYSSSFDKAVSVPLVIPYDVRGLADGCLNTKAEGSDYPFAIRFNPDGTRVYIMDSTDDKIYQWALHTPYVLGRGALTAVFEGSSSVLSTPDPIPRAFDWTPDGRGMFVTGGNNDTIYYYTVETPFDATSTLTYVSVFDVTFLENYPQAMRLVNAHSKNDGGYKLQFIGTGSDDIFEYDINY